MGCTGTASVIVTINPLPTITVSPSSNTICSGTNVSLTASGATTYSWTPSTGLSATTGSIVTASPTVTTTYTVTGTNTNGCINNTTVKITVSTPFADAGADNATSLTPVVIGGNPTASNGISPYTYLWTPSSGLNSTTIANPIATSTVTTTYTVTVTDAIGCSAKDSVQLFVVLSPPSQVMDTSKINFLYYGNQGQLINTSGQAIPDVKFYTNYSSPSLYFTNNSFSMVFAHIDTVAATQDTLQRIDVNFLQANPNVKVYPRGQKVSGYLNYFLPQCPNGITANGNMGLVTPNLYPNIDLIYLSNNNTLKYCFVVRPGGNTANILTKYTGASSINLNGTTNYLTINSTIGNISFIPPIAYELHLTDSTIVPTTASWVDNGAGTYSFNIGTYNHAQILLIEVGGDAQTGIRHISSPEWSQYFGGNGYDEGTGVTTDTDGNPYFTGFTASSNFPITTGVVQGSFGGNFDVYIARFGSANGASHSIVPNADKLQWATYYGGSGEDKAFGISTSGDGTTGHVFVTGYTTNGGFPKLANGSAYYQATNAGGKDAFIIRLDNKLGGAAPTLDVWATHFGGYGDDIGKCIKTDGTNFYIAGNTNSGTYSTVTCDVPYPTDNNFPKCSTYSAALGYGGGQSDGFIAKFNGSGQLIWSSFYGGTGNDTINAMSVNATTHVLTLTGITSSPGAFPLHTLTGTGVYNQGTNGGALGTTDAFVSQFNSSGTNVWCSYYGGDGDDGGYAITQDSNNNIYIAGKTSSSTPACSTTCMCAVPTTGQFPMCHPSGSYFQGTGNVGSYGGGTDGFVAKFNSSGILTWGTYYGGSTYDIITGLAMDYRDQLFFTGKTLSASPSSNLYDGTLPFSGYTWWYDQSNLQGVSDCFMGYFDATNARPWASYFGGTSKEFGNSIAVYSTAPNNEFWYITGATGSTDFHTMAFNSISDGDCCPNAYLDITSNGATDAIVARFSITGMYMMGVENISNKNTFDALVYPNPASYDVTLKLNLSEKENVNIVVYSITGQLLYTEAMGKQQGEITKQINFSAFNNGVYLLQIKTDNKMVSKKIIKHD